METITNICSGCGVCAAVCPKQCISIQASKEGGWEAIRSKECTQCGLCEKVCWGSGRQITSIMNLSGTSTSYWVGYASDERIRINSASGGMTTAFLGELLEQRLVEQVVCVHNVNKEGRLFEFQICKTQEELFDSARSAYYPVEASDIIKKIVEERVSTAIVGLPCFLTSIRQAMKFNSQLKNVVKYLIGLVCGQMKSKYYTEWILDKLKINKLPLKISFRTKSPERATSNFLFHVQDDKSEKELGWIEALAPVWMSGMFKLKACFGCQDVFAESADVVFMDAWLPEYSSSPKGYSLVVSKNEIISRLLQHSQSFVLSPISRERVLQSQNGPIELKQKMADSSIATKEASWNPFDRMEAKHYRQLSFDYKEIASKSNELWHNGERGESFDVEMKPMLLRLELHKADYLRFKKIRKLLGHPFKTVSSVFGAQFRRLFK